MARFRVWTLYCCCLVFGNGESLCKKELLKRSNVSTEIQSDVLLPCNFDPALLGSDKTADIAVVWKQKNTTRHGLLEISLRGELSFWNNKDGRIKHFPKLSESGNFSILLQKVQPYDRSLYTCELFNGTSCSIGYQEVELQSNQQTAEVSGPSGVATAVARAVAGAVLLCLFLICLCEISNKRKPQPQPESRRETCYTEVMYTLQITEQP